MPKYSPDVQKALDEALKVKAAHEAALLKLPGVHTVSVHPKTIGGIRSTEFAIVVSVEQKKSPEELGPGQLIPPMLDGVKTDVQQSSRSHMAGAPPDTKTDDNNYPYVIGGAQIVSEGMRKSKAIPNTNKTAISVATGTLGCLAINQNTSDATKKVVALTNAHVVLDIIQTTTHDDSAVGQPDTSSLCCKSLDHTIGHLDHDAVLTGFDPTSNPASPPNGVDAAFITLDPDVQWSAEVIASGEGGSITKEQIAGAHIVDGTEALFDFSSGSGVPIYAVHKRGIRTDDTVGWLISIAATVDVQYQSFALGSSKVLRFVNTLEIQPHNAGQYFNAEGDSGAAVVNANHQVVGLVFAGPSGNNPPSKCNACAIGDVQTRLNVVVADAATYPGVRTVPKSATGTAFAELPAERNVLRERMQAAREDLETTPIGSQLDDALHRHFTEIRTLVNQNRRAGVTWRRIEGPKWINEVLNCLLDRKRPLPSQLAEQSLGSCLDKLSAVLTQYGSEALVSDLTRFAPVLRNLAGRSLDQTVHEWRMQAAL
jgi:hypothetical protein